MAIAGPERRLSQIVADLAQAGSGDRVKLLDIVSALGDRTYGVLMLIFALPNAIGLGTIPGLSTVFGVPQIFLALQMIAGRERPWLPAWLLEKSIARTDVATMAQKSAPYLVRAERALRQRWLFMTSPAAERCLGVVFALMALIVSLPIPFGNQPPAVAMAFLSVGLAERDGIYIVIGLFVAALATVVAGGVVAGFVAAALFLFHSAFG